MAVIHRCLIKVEVVEGGGARECGMKQQRRR